MCSSQNALTDPSNITYRQKDCTYYEVILGILKPSRLLFLRTESFRKRKWEIFVLHTLIIYRCLSASPWPTAEVLLSYYAQNVNYGWRPIYVTSYSRTRSVFSISVPGNLGWAWRYCTRTLIDCNYKWGQCQLSV